MDIPRSEAEVARDVIEPMMRAVAGHSEWPIVLTGSVGVGKTCAALVLTDLVRGSRTYTTVSDASMQLIDAMNGRLDWGSGPVTRREWWDRWAQWDLAVLDELGVREHVSDAHYELVKMAIDRRHGCPTVFISNLSIAEIAQRYDDRVASRLSAGTVINVYGDDRRVK